LVLIVLLGAGTLSLIIHSIILDIGAELGYETLMLAQRIAEQIDMVLRN
jgi:tRNA1(Val) A37 N6-methylase TrmN6